MANKEIVIGVDSETGDIHYSRSVMHAQKGEEIEWISSNGPFAVQFTGVSPLNQVGRRAVRNEARGLWVVRGEVRTEAAPAAYPYVCAVYTDGRVFVDAGCPEIIIDW